MGDDISESTSHGVIYFGHATSASHAADFAVGPPARESSKALAFVWRVVFEVAAGVLAGAILSLFQ